MSGSKKRVRGGPAEHIRSTQSSAVNKRTAASESVDSGGSRPAENLVLMCSCGSSGPSKEEMWKEDPVVEQAAGEKKGEKPTDVAAAAAAAAAVVIIPEKAVVIEETLVDEQQEKLNDSESGEKIESSENSFDETGGVGGVEASEQQQINASTIEERMNSTSFSQENYRTPLLSPDLWPQEDADEVVHQDLDNVKLESMSRRDDDAAERKVDDWYRIREEKSSDPDWSGSPDRGGILVQEMQQSRGIEPKESPGNYDRLTADTLISVIESHRDALNDQKVLLAQQTDAINRLASAVEKQTKIISTLNENKLPIHN